MISGGGEAWKVAAALKEAGVPVLVGGTLNAPVPRSRSLRLRLCEPGPAARGRGHRRDPVQERGPRRGDRRPEPPLRGGDRDRLRPSRGRGPQGGDARPRPRSWASPTRSARSKPASAPNLVVTAGHILQPTTSVLALFIDGKHVTPESRHTQLYARYLRRLQEVRAGTAPLGLDRPSTAPARHPDPRAASPSPASP